MTDAVLEFVSSYPMQTLSIIGAVLGGLNLLPHKWSRNITEIFTAIRTAISRYQSKKKELQKRIEGLEKKLDQLANSANKIEKGDSDNAKD